MHFNWSNHKAVLSGPWNESSSVNQLSSLNPCLVMLHCEVECFFFVPSSIQVVLSFVSTLGLEIVWRLTEPALWRSYPCSLHLSNEHRLTSKPWINFDFEVSGIKFYSDSIWTTSSRGQCVKSRLAETVLHFCTSLPYWPSPSRALLMNGGFVVHAKPCVLGTCQWPAFTHFGCMVAW